MRYKVFLMTIEVPKWHAPTLKQIDMNLRIAVLSIKQNNRSNLKSWDI